MPFNVMTVEPYLACGVTDDTENTSRVPLGKYVLRSTRRMHARAPRVRGMLL